MDHPIYFSSRNLSRTEHNYISTKREGLAMVYALQKFRHYLLGGHFKFFTDHSTLKYLVNNHVLEGRICRWLLLFQVFSFDVVFNLGKLHVGPDNLSWLELEESGGVVDDQLPNAHILKIKAISNYLYNIALFLTTSTTPEGCFATQKKHLVVCAANYQLITSKLYKLGLENNLRRCVLDHE
jgi:hypothetical protein